MKLIYPCLLGICKATVLIIVFYYTSTQRQWPRPSSPCWKDGTKADCRANRKRWAGELEKDVVGLPAAASALVQTFWGCKQKSAGLTAMPVLSPIIKWWQQVSQLHPTCPTLAICCSHGCDEPWVHLWDVCWPHSGLYVSLKLLEKNLHCFSCIMNSSFRSAEYRLFSLKFCLNLTWEELGALSLREEFWEAVVRHLLSLGGTWK